MMMEALKILSRFTHSPRTNLTKGRLSNHDALAFILLTCGPMDRTQVADVMMCWRFGKATRSPKKVHVYDYRTGQGKSVKRILPKMAFDYLLNGSTNSGYGFTSFKPEGGSIKIYHYQANGEGIYDRRQYWYRAGKNLYAITLEGMKRCSELNLTAVAAMLDVLRPKTADVKDRCAAADIPVVEVKVARVTAGDTCGLPVVIAPKQKRLVTGRLVSYVDGVATVEVEE